MKFFNDFVRASFCLAVALIAIEFAMRGAGERFQASFYTSDPVRGYALRPRAEGWNVTENRNYVQVNSRGLRDREHDLKRPANTIRIAVIGDSESEALQVPQQRTYWSVLERALNAAMPRSGPRVEVINFGVGGYGLAPQYFTLKDCIWEYDPQVVLVVNSIDTLILRSSRSLFPGDSYGAPFFEIRDGHLQLDQQTQRERVMPRKGPGRSWTANLMNRSSLLSLVNSSRVKIGNQARDFMGRFHAHAATESSLPPGFWKTWGYLGPANPELKSAWDVSEALILAMRDEASRHDTELWMCVINIPSQADPDPRQREELRKRVGVGSLFASNEMMRMFVTQNGIRYMDVAQTMSQLAESRKVIFHGFPGTPRNTGHYNEAGHEALGRVIAANLAAESTRLPGPALQVNRGTDVSETSDSESMRMRVR